MNDTQTKEVPLKSPLLDSIQAARYLRISERNLFTLRKRGLIAPVAIGALIFYRKETLDRFIETAETTGPSHNQREV